MADEGEVPAGILEPIRERCLALPDAYEEPAWTGIRWLVRKKTFAHVLLIDAGWPPVYAREAGTDGPACVLMFRSSGDDLEALRQAGPPWFAPVWRADVGRTPLYLLDADIDDNEPDMREVTDRLYGGDVEHRLQQEILLGMGGVRMLEALGLDVQVFHTNEGHAGFLGLERMHRLITKEGLSFAEAIEAVRASSLFTRLMPALHSATHASTTMPLSTT